MNCLGFKIYNNLTTRVPKCALGNLFNKTRIINHPHEPKNLVRHRCTDGKKDPIEGKVALITGGSRGIGLECAKALIKNKAKGVMLADLEEKDGKEAMACLAKECGPGKASFIKTNVCNECQLEHAFKCTLEVWKQLDIVINNAAIFDDCEWEEAIGINCASLTRGTLLGIDYMGEHKKHAGGTIVNMSSVLGIQPLAGCPIHCATKAFVIALTRGIGQLHHFCRSKVKVVALCPGLTLTPLTKVPMDKETGEVLTKELEALKAQPAWYVGEALICLLHCAETGSVWVSEDCQPIYSIEFPNLRCMKTA